MSSAVERIRRAIAGTPWEGRLWLVGGAVRDALLGREAPPDLDIVVEGDARAVAANLATAGVGDSAPVDFPRFGTATLRVEGVSVDLVTARRERYHSSSRKPTVEAANLHEDALRRDFTVNTLLRNVSTGELADPLGRGLADLEARIIRTPLDPRATFHEDPLRMLRAVRFRWQLGFDFAPGVAQAIRDQTERLTVVSAERVREEFAKLLVGPDADRALQELLDLGLLAQFAPEFLPMVGLEQGSYHHLDAWGHTLLAIRNTASCDLVTRLAVLFHDIGKPATRTRDATGKTRFFDHERVGAEIAALVLRRLTFPNETAASVSTLVRNHMRLSSAPEPTPAAARRLARDLAALLPAFLDMVEADTSALRPGVRRLDLGRVREIVGATLAETPVETIRSPLSGDEIMALTGLRPGAEVGRLKEMLVEEVVEGRLPAGDKDAAREFLARAQGRATGEPGPTSRK